MQDSEIIKQLSEAMLKNHESHWALISRLQNKEPWTGEGLPPVGTVCEWHPNVHGWVEVTILGHDGDDTWYRVKGEDHTQTCRNMAFFRPIRTPEQIAAEKREADIEELRVLLSNVACDDYQAAVAMIDAGYHK